MSTSIGNEAGWDADVTEAGTVVVVIDPPPTADKPHECNLVCKTDVLVSPGIYSAFDFIMNPGACSLDDYLFEFIYPPFTTQYPTKNIVDQSHVGKTLMYKVWLKNMTNYCWGNVKITP